MTLRDQAIDRVQRTVIIGRGDASLVVDAVLGVFGPEALLEHLHRTGALSVPPADLRAVTEEQN